MSSSTTEPTLPGATAAADRPRAAADAAATVDVLMPQMGTSMVEGTIVAWRVAVGEEVVRDQVLCEVSTDKVDVECPAAQDGVLAEIVVEAGETVDVGTVIARLRTTVPGTTAGAGPGTAERPGPSGPGAADPTARPEPTVRPAEVADHPAGSAADDRRAVRRETLRRSSPVASRLATEHGLDVLALAGSGRNGRVTKRDVLRAAAREPVAEAPMHSDSPYRHDPSIPVAGSPPAGPSAVVAVPSDLGGVPEPVSRMRRSIGAAVRRSLDTAAHCTTVVECDMSRIERGRRDAGLTALPLLAHATIETLRAFPALNATFDGEIVTRFGDRVHLGIAVSLGEDGLIAPVIHDAQDLSVAGLARRIKDLAVRARAGDLHPDEVRGGTFTITNPGAAGALMATPVLNLPQVAILDLEAVVRRPVVVTDADGNESIGIRPMVHLCMGWDHRALDGLYAAQFLTALRRRVEG